MQGETLRKIGFGGGAIMLFISILLLIALGILYGYGVYSNRGNGCSDYFTRFWYVFLILYILVLIMVILSWASLGLTRDDYGSHDDDYMY